MISVLDDLKFIENLFQISTTSMLMTSSNSNVFEGELTFEGEKKISETFWNCSRKCIWKSALGLPTSEQMLTSARIWHFKVYSGKSAEPISTSLDVEFSIELGVGLNNGEESTTGMSTSELVLPYRRRREVDEPNANFRTVQALFIVVIGFANFGFLFVRTDLG